MFMLHALLYFYYIIACTLYVFKFCYIFLFPYFILNLFDNDFISIICTKLL